jgi:hypothetical protein
LNRRKTISFLSAIIAAAALSTAPARASYAEGAFQIINPASGNIGCIQPPGFVKDVQLTTAVCDGNELQHWIFEPLGNSRYHIRNEATGWCMHAVSNSDFAVVDTIDCTNISNNVWFIPSTNSTTDQPFQIKSEISTGGEPCLDLKGGASTNQLKPIDVFHCTSNNLAQLFRL